MQSFKSTVKDIKGGNKNNNVYHMCINDKESDYKLTEVSQHKVNKSYLVVFVLYAYSLITLFLFVVHLLCILQYIHIQIILLVYYFKNIL